MNIKVLIPIGQGYKKLEKIIFKPVTLFVSLTTMRLFHFNIMSLTLERTRQIYFSLKLVSV